MPRKFKLIVTYPHPTYLLIVDMIIELQGSIYVEEGIKAESKKMTFGRQIENYPNYWEEIIELPKLYDENDMLAAYIAGNRGSKHKSFNTFMTFHTKQGS